MAQKRSAGITMLAVLYPIFMLFLIPEIINSVVWLLDFIAVKSGLSRSINNSPVGIGMIFAIAAFAVIGFSILFLSGLVIILTIIGTKGLLQLSEKARKRTIVLNSIYIVFIVYSVKWWNAATKECLQKLQMRLFCFTLSQHYFSSPAPR